MTDPDLRATTRFATFGFSDALVRRLAEIGDESPSHVQTLIFPLLMARNDLLAMVNTGMGKTMAYVLPLLHNIDLDLTETQVLVLVATDEAALHVAEIFQSIARHLQGFHVHPLYNLPSAAQLRQLGRGVHVVVGNPRRVVYHLEEQRVVLSGLKTLVIDEFDHVMRAGFRDDLYWILGRLSGGYHTAVFSATLTPELLLFSRGWLHHPVFVSGNEAVTIESQTRQRHWQVGPLGKLNALTRLTEIEQDLDAALVFVRNRNRVIELSEKLKARGFSCAGLDADSSPEQRQYTSGMLANGQIDVLVVTDLAAVQLDLSRITHVISYDLPCDSASYVHRLEHVERQGRQGASILLLTTRELGMLHSLEKAMRSHIPKLELPERVR